MDDIADIKSPSLWAYLLLLWFSKDMYLMSSVSEYKINLDPMYL